MGSAFKIMGTAVVIVYLGLNYYIGLRSFQTLKVYYPLAKPWIFWPIFLLIAFAYFLDRIISLKIPFLRMIGSYWLAAFLYLLLFYLLIDITGLLNNGLKFLPSTWLVLWENKKIYTLGLILTTGVLIVGTWVAQNPHISKYDIAVAKKAEGLTSLKIVLISDLHVDAGARTDFMLDAARTITAMNPDLILLGGDLIDGSFDQITKDKLANILNNLQAKSGIYAVLGNHDYFGREADQLTSYLEGQGVNVLRDNLSEALDGKIYIAGREDRSGNFGSQQRKPLSDILKGIDPGKPLILLDHQPVNIEEAQSAGVDLMFSGHTHGGQLFPAQFFTKALFVIDRGLWTNGNFHLIVSTGLGVWGPPIRTSARSEIVAINVHFTGQ